MSASVTGTSEWTEASEEVGRYWKDKKTTVLYLNVVRFYIKALKSGTTCSCIKSYKNIVLPKLCIFLMLLHA